MELKFTKYKSFWKVTDENGNTASGKTKEEAEQKYRLIYEHFEKINFSPKNPFDN